MCYGRHLFRVFLSLRDYRRFNLVVIATSLSNEIQHELSHETFLLSYFFSHTEWLLLISRDITHSNHCRDWFFDAKLNASAVFSVLTPIFHVKFENLINFSLSEKKEIGIEVGRRWKRGKKWTNKMFHYY